MDPLEAADALIAAIAAGDDLPPLLAPDVHFRSDVHGTLGAQEVAALLAERASGFATRFLPGERVMKRNLVFAWFRYEDMDGKTKEQGTWLLSFDREGRVMEWNEFRG